MLDEEIRVYLDKFKAAAETHRHVETLKVINEMKAHFTAHPANMADVIRYLNDMAAGVPPVGASLVFTPIWCNLSNVYEQPLCRILESEQAKGFHEQSVEVLSEIGSPHAIAALKKAIGYRWDYDLWLSVPKKALQALQSIGTPEAISIILEAAASSDSRIREEAKSLLEDPI
jgi:HEAT repeat protein